MTREAFILHDALDYIDTATHKAALLLEYVADYFDAEPIDPARIIVEQDTVRTLVNITLDYLHQIKRQYAEAMTATAPSTDTDSDHTNAQTEPDSRSHSADHGSTEASSTTHDSTSDHTAHDTNGKSAAPMTAEQAAERIQYISIEDATDSTATAYKAAILQWVNDNEPETPAQYMTFALAYAAGLQEGKRQEREARRNRQSKPET